MSTSIKAFIALSLLTVVTACGGQQEEVVVVAPEPIVAEPVMDKM